MTDVEKLFEDLPKSRAEAIKVGSTYYFTGKPCIHGHIDRRKVRGGCYTCWVRLYYGRDKETGEPVVYDNQGVRSDKDKSWSYTELRRAYDELKVKCAEKDSKIEELTKKIRDLNHDVERYRDG